MWGFLLVFKIFFYTHGNGFCRGRRGEANKKAPLSPKETKARNLCGTTLLAALQAAPRKRITAPPVPAYGMLSPSAGRSEVIFPRPRSPPCTENGGSLGSTRRGTPPHHSLVRHSVLSPGGDSLSILSVSRRSVKSRRGKSRFGLPIGGRMWYNTLCCISPPQG